jgi:hypothetical protein
MRGRLTVDVHSAGDQRVDDIYLTLITSKPRYTNPSEMSSAGVVNVAFILSRVLVTKVGVRIGNWIY